MLAALLKGKLSREQENMEDILTSNVFGTLKYASPEEALVSFLARAELPNGNVIPFAETSAVKADYEFWPRPRWQEEGCIGCEPDIVLRIDCTNERRFIVLVEAKFHSGKSSEADEKPERPNDQLAKEWDNLTYKAKDEKRLPIMIYLTADFGIPVEEIEDSRREFAEKRVQETEYPFECYWLSWRHLPKILGDEDNPMLKDLAAVLERLNLTFFEGISPVEYLGPGSWAFERGFNWTVTQAVTIDWTFSRVFDWSVETTPSVTWKFE